VEIPSVIWTIDNPEDRDWKRLILRAPSVMWPAADLAGSFKQKFKMAEATSAYQGTSAYQCTSETEIDNIDWDAIFEIDTDRGFQQISESEDNCSSEDDGPSEVEENIFVSGT
jgi:hypothetical protein